MPYAAPSNLENAIGTVAYLRVVDRAGDGTVDTIALEESLERASSFADTFIPLPVPTPTPKSLVDAVVWIAWYYVAGESFTTYQRQRYEDAVSWLSKVQAGKATLGVTPPETAAPSTGTAQVVSQPRVMTRESLGRLF